MGPRAARQPRIPASRNPAHCPALVSCGHERRHRSLAEFVAALWSDLVEYFTELERRDNAPADLDSILREGDDPGANRCGSLAEMGVAVRSPGQFDFVFFAEHMPRDANETEIGPSSYLVRRRDNHKGSIRLWISALRIRHRIGGEDDPTLHDVGHMKTPLCSHSGSLIHLLNVEHGVVLCDFFVQVRRRAGDAVLGDFFFAEPHHSDCTLHAR